MERTAAALFAGIEKGAWPKALVLHGDDGEQIRGIVSRLAAALVRDEPDAAVERFDSGEFAGALDAVRTGALFGGHRLVVVSGVEWLGAKSDESAREAFTRYLDGPPAQGTLVLLAEKVDGRVALVKRMEREGALIPCALPSEREIPRYLAERARARGLELPPAAIQALADAVGTDAGLAARELDKLVLVAPRPGPDGAPVRLSPQQVEAMLGPTKAVGAFALEDAILRRDAAEALETLSRHVEAEGVGSPLPLLARLASMARRLAVAEGVAHRRGSEDDLRSRLGCHPFVAKKYWEAARQGSARGTDGLAACVTADRALKSGGDARSALRTVVLALVGRTTLRGQHVRRAR